MDITPVNYLLRQRPNPFDSILAGYKGASDMRAAQTAEDRQAAFYRMAEETYQNPTYENLIKLTARYPDLTGTLGHAVSTQGQLISNTAQSVNALEIAKQKMVAEQRQRELERRQKLQDEAIKRQQAMEDARRDQNWKLVEALRAEGVKAQQDELARQQLYKNSLGLQTHRAEYESAQAATSRVGRYEDASDLLAQRAADAVAANEAEAERKAKEAQDKAAAQAARVEKYKRVMEAFKLNPTPEALGMMQAEFGADLFDRETAEILLEESRAKKAGDILAVQSLITSGDIPGAQALLGQKAAEAANIGNSDGARNLTSLSQLLTTPDGPRIVSNFNTSSLLNLGEPGSKALIQMNEAIRTGRQNTPKARQAEEAAQDVAIASGSPGAIQNATDLRQTQLDAAQEQLTTARNANDTELVIAQKQRAQREATRLPDILDKVRYTELPAAVDAANDMLTATETLLKDAPRILSQAYIGKTIPGEIGRILGDLSGSQNEKLRNWEKLYNNLVTLPAALKMVEPLKPVTELDFRKILDSLPSAGQDQEFVLTEGLLRANLKAFVYPRIAKAKMAWIDAFNDVRPATKAANIAGVSISRGDTLEDLLERVKKTALKEYPDYVREREDRQAAEAYQAPVEQPAPQSPNPMGNIPRPQIQWYPAPNGGFYSN